MDLTKEMKNSNNNIEKIINLMQNDESVDAPSDAIKWSKNIFKSRAMEPKQGLLQKIAAVLVQDLAPGKAAVGERSGATGQARQMLFEAGENRIDLRVTQKNEAFDIRGQILGEGWEGSSIEFAGKQTGPDEFGGFKFGEVEAGRYNLTIRGDEIEIVLIGIELE